MESILNVRTKCSEKETHIACYDLVTSFQSFAKNKIPDFLVILFGSGVPDFTKHIFFLFWVTLFGMLLINAFRESISFKRTESCR